MFNYNIKNRLMDNRIFTLDDKKKLKEKIEKLHTRELIEKIKNIILKNNPQLSYTKNSSGVLLFFHNLTNETYEKIEFILRKHEAEKIKTIEILSDEKSSITIEQVSNLKELPQNNNRLSSLEKNIIKKKDYYDKLKEENNCDEDIIYKSEDDPDIFLNKFSDKTDDNINKKKSNTKVSKLKKVNKN
jgi:hypothetical protein